MKWNPSNPKSAPKPRTIKKTIIIDCWTGKEYDVNRKTTKIIDGMEIGKQVELDNGVKLTIAGEGKYHTLGNPKERWAEVAEVRVEPDGEYGDGELLGWTPLFSPKKPQTPKRSVAFRAPADSKKKTGFQKAAPRPGKPTEKPAQAAPGPGKPTEKPAQAAPRPGKPTEKPAQAAPRPGKPTEKPARTTERPIPVPQKPSSPLPQMKNSSVSSSASTAGKLPPRPKKKS